MLWQKALLKEELRTVFANAKIPPKSALADADVRRAYMRATGKLKDEKHARPPCEGDCPICFEGGSPPPPRGLPGHGAPRRIPRWHLSPASPAPLPRRAEAVGRGDHPGPTHVRLVRGEGRDLSG